MTKIAHSNENAYPNNSRMSFFVASNGTFFTIIFVVRLLFLLLSFTSVSSVPRPANFTTNA